MRFADCKQCDGPIPGTAFCLDVVRDPYNPDWPKERVDAGRFCSPQCLAEYLVGAAGVLGVNR